MYNEEMSSVFQILKLQYEFFFLWWLQMQMVNDHSQNLNLLEIN
jgi:hypothetical protein